MMMFKQQFPGLWYCQNSSKYMTAASGLRQDTSICPLSSVGSSESIWTGPDLMFEVLPLCHLWLPFRCISLTLATRCIRERELMAQQEHC